MPNIIFAGTEDIDFVPFGSGNFIEAGSSFYPNFRPNWVSYPILNAIANSSASDPPTNYFETPQFTAETVLWFSAQVAWSQITGWSTNAHYLRFLDPSGVCRLIMRVASPSGGAFKISTRNAAATITDILTLTTFAAQFPTFSGSRYKLDIAINYGTSGSVTVYANGIQLGSFSGNVTTDGATQLAQVQIADTGDGGPSYYSEIMVLDSDSRSAGLWKMNSNTAGNTQNWVGPPDNPVNQTTPANDTQYIASPTAGQISEYQTGGIPVPVGNYNVVGVVMAMRALVGLTGPQHVEFVTRADGTDYTGGSWAPGTAFSNQGNYIQEINPATSIAFTVADITNTTFNFGVESAA